MTNQEAGEPTVAIPPISHHPKRSSFVPRLVTAGRQGWHTAKQTWQEYPARARGDAHHAASVGHRLARTWNQLTAEQIRRLVIGLVVVGLVIGSCGVLNLHGGLDALAAARDAKAQVTAIMGSVKGGGVTDPAHLQEVQMHLNSLDSDLQRLQAAVPLEPVLAGTPGISSPIHLLRMASDLVHAGQAAMPGVIILAPHLKEMLTSLQGTDSATAKTTASPGPGAASSAQQTPPPPLTPETVRVAASDLDRALPFLQAALSERAHVSDATLGLLGLGKYTPMLHALDAYTPYLPKILTALHAGTAALPSLLGVGHPTTFLLFSLDSDELRPTGGFIGNYALITLAGGKFTDRVHLHDIYSLDCPLGYLQCPARPIPAQFAWMNVNSTHFGLRDSNLDPDYPASARLAERMLTQDEGGPAVQGVISITPRVIEQLLEATGPITLDSFCAQVSAQNLRDTIHYFHLSTPLGISTWCLGPQPASADRKGLDAELGSLLLHRVATLPLARQNELVHALLSDFVTRDIQIYFNDPGLEAALTSFGVDGSIQAPRGDSLYVVDTNTGATYANIDVQEQVVDAITIDRHGTATHNLTLTYNYPKSSHIYEDVYNTEGLYPTYRDFVRVIVPSQAQFISQGGCPPYPTYEAQHAVWGCSILFAQPNSVTLHFRWSVSGAAAVHNGSLRYNLLIQHQAGTRVAVNVSIIPPTGYQLTGSPTAPLISSSGAQVRYADTLSQDQVLQVNFEH